MKNVIISHAMNMNCSVLNNLSFMPTLNQALVLHLQSQNPPKCPPRGSESVIFYTTSLRSIRKTHEDCNTIRFLLESLGVKFLERDVSMDMELKEELWRVMGGGRVIPPRLFIKGRYIGGAEEVVALHEQGRFVGFFDGLPLKVSKGPCKGCGGLRFVVCWKCDGSCKVDGEEKRRCGECNENGLVKCSICV